ncbi:hypothetical protein WJX72_004989 [[Myrmecia] bisecta]|uniref:Hikeshi-like C-terminal domain-containing protein n=1 Tax=[Myrmecia] bisecta TaxID=41462 RepID=A0AAW1QF05_9CHLO
MAVVSLAGPLFGSFFVGHSFPITSANFVNVDATHWVLDVGATVNPDYQALKEVALFLLTPGALDTSLALGLYISLGGAEWQYRGFVSNGHPSEVMPLQWPEAPVGLVMGPGMVQLGVSIEPYVELVQKEGSRLASKQEYAKRVAMDLFHFMESFSTGNGNQLLLPSNALEQWFTKFNSKFQRDPDFLLHRGEKSTR